MEHSATWRVRTAPRLTAVIAELRAAAARHVRTAFGALDDGAARRIRAELEAAHTNVLGRARIALLVRLAPLGHLMMTARERERSQASTRHAAKRETHLRARATAVIRLGAVAARARAGVAGRADKVRVARNHFGETLARGARTAKVLAARRQQAQAHVEVALKVVGAQQQPQIGLVKQSDAALGVDRRLRAVRTANRQALLVEARHHVSACAQSTATGARGANRQTTNPDE